MGRPRSDAPARLAGAAATLLRRRGYHATGVKEIAAEASVPIGSVYFHFPGGKREIVLAALGGAGDSVEKLLAKLVADAPNARTGVAAYLAFLTDLLHGSGYTDGCPIATTALEVAAEDAAVAAACDRAFGAWRDQLRQKLETDGYDEPDRLATAVLAAVEGGLVLARAARDTAPLAAVAAELDDLLRARR